MLDRIFDSADFRFLLLILFLSRLKREVAGIHMTCAMSLRYLYMRGA